MKTKLEKKIVKISPKVGDYVMYDDNNILEILPRKNEMIRPDVSNVDYIVLVFSCINPDFSFLLLDKFLISIKKDKINCYIIITKIDLISNDKLNDLKNKLKYYEKFYKIDYISNKKTDNIDYIINNLKNKFVVFSGQTGAGKSSLLNRINPKLQLQTNEISIKLGRGKHTTRHTEMFIFDDLYISDTPGFSSLDFINFKETELKDYYPDFDKLKDYCKFRGCNHINEPNCKVIEEYQNNNILKSRYENYVKFFHEIKNQKVIY